MTSDNLEVRTVGAVDQLWRRIMKYRQFVGRFIDFQNVYIPSQYPQALKRPTDQSIIQRLAPPEYFESLKLFDLEIEFESIRPFIGEALWDQFLLYRVFVMRQFLKVFVGTSSNVLLRWDEDLDHGRDERIYSLLNSFFSQEELAKLISDNELGVAQRLMRAIESTMLTAMRNQLYKGQGESLDIDKLVESLKITNQFQAQNIVSIIQSTVGGDVTGDSKVTAGDGSAISTD